MQPGLRFKRVDEQLSASPEDDQVLGWKRKGDTAELITTQPKFDPKTSWLILDALEAIKRACTWVGCCGDAVADSFTQPFVKLVGQRPQELDGIKSLYEAASWEVCIQMTSGQTFETAVTDVVGRSQWSREFLEDYKLDTRGRVGTTRDNNFDADTCWKIPKGKGKGKYQRRSSKSPCRLRRSPDLLRRVPSPRSKHHHSKTPQRSRTPPKHRRQSDELCMKSEKENGRQMSKKKCARSPARAMRNPRALPQSPCSQVRRVPSLWSRVRRLLVPLVTSRGRDVCASGIRPRAKHMQGMDQRAERVAEKKLVVVYVAPPTVESHFQCSWYCLEFRG